MKSFRKYWKVLMDTGTYSGMSYIESKRVHMVNLIALICIFPTIYFATVNFIEHRYLLSTINLFSTISSLSVLLFQYYGKLNFAKVMLLASNYLFFFAGALLYRNGGEYFLLCILIVSMLLYDSRRVHVVFGTAVILAIVIIYTSPIIVFFEKSVPRSRAVYNIVSALAFILVVVNFFKQIIYNNMRKIEQQRLKLQSINQEKEKVFSIIAHDIKSPFASLEGMVCALKEQLLHGAAAPEFIQHLHQQIIQQNQTLDDLLQWGSSNLRGIEHRSETVIVKPILDDIIRLFDEQIRLKQLTIHLNINDETAVFANKDHVIVILRNFISNAIKFSYTKGQISIYTSVNKELTFIHIKDEGVGINASQSALLFNIVQHKSLGTGDEPGAGLGLVLCRDLIERNNGEVDIKSIPNEGSVFSVGLPTQNPLILYSETLSHINKLGMEAKKVASH
ncbi:sensor histidine kinase [Sphingobacterium sp. SYP-B4668]|uniref:sensor histidine kinase n=1 Tax=Sphingobacterium sp. SYP-B4668 TaxID=2996035 RepID=UPI0022DE85B3|nr:HAMP domain-containing sensor histidine kinase [Sphingobacterium sp. SYP-B4668]